MPNPMKPNLLLSSAVLCSIGCMALVTQCSDADHSSGCQSWKVVDDFQLATNQDAENFTAATDAQGNTYVLGYANDSNSVKRWVIRKSSGTLSSWSTVYQDTDTESSENNFGIIAHQSTLYVATSSLDGTLAKARVFKSTDAAVTWTRVRNYTHSSGINSAMSAILTDSSGNLFAAGEGGLSGYDRWLLHKSTDSGANWSLVDDAVLADSKDTSVEGIGRDPAGNIYAVGAMNDSSNTVHWITRKTTDTGSSWSNIDNYQLASGKDAKNQGISSTSTGILFAVGSATDSSSVQHWIVRKSTDAGITWATVDDYQYASSRSAVAYSIVIDSADTIYVTGSANDSSDISHWILRRSTDKGGSWSVPDSYQYSPSKNATAYGLALNLNGNVLTLGGAVDATGKRHALVRKCE